MRDFCRYYVMKAQQHHMYKITFLRITSFNIFFVVVVFDLRILFWDVIFASLFASNIDYRPVFRHTHTLCAS